MDPIAFQRKWIGITLTERSASQSHFLDLCSVLGVQSPTDADPTGTFYTFERGAEKASGGDGWADVWYRGHFAWEYKGKKSNLNAAYLQLLQYKDDLENPPLMIVSDLNRIEVRTNFTDTPTKIYEINLATFAEPENQSLLRKVFTDPHFLKPGSTRETVTLDAARSFSQIAQGMQERGIEPTKAAHYLVQLLFCLFAEDVGLLPNMVFSKMVSRGLRRPQGFQANSENLLKAMNSGGEVAYEDVPKFNGGLFRTVDVPALTTDEIKVLRDATELDWSAVEPAIFGTLFERSLDPSKRAQLGAHYTGRHDIERVVEPVMMLPLRKRWAEVRAEADELKRQWDDAQAALTDTNRRRQDRYRSLDARRNAFAKKVADFQEELSSIKVLDPACGSGNFLYVALERLLALEKEVMTYRANSGLPLGLPSVRPTQVLGLELNEYAQELAQVAIWIGYLQWMNLNGFPGLSEPILDPLVTIQRQDALLDCSGPTAVEATWPATDFIIGNPPFIGPKDLRTELSTEYTKDLHRVFKGRVPGMANLCLYWFEKARAAIEAGHARRAGLLGTTNIRTGKSRNVLERIKHSGDIFLAWTNERWSTGDQGTRRPDDASVRISIVGFDDGSETTKILDGSPVSSITSSLTSAPTSSSAKSLAENGGIAFAGIVKGAPFELSEEVAHGMLSQPVNPNGRPNSDVIKPWYIGRSLVQRRPKQWIIDFGVDMPELEAAQYESPFEYTARVIKPKKEEVKGKRESANWWIHNRPIPGMRQALSKLPRFVATPATSKHRVYVWLEPPSLVGNSIVAFARSDDYFFGVLQSRASEIWALSMARRQGVGNDPVYSVETFESFPLPWTPGSELVGGNRLVAIAIAAKELVRLRSNWLAPEGSEPEETSGRTLTSLYNDMPRWLINAHMELDRAVWDAYGWDDPNPREVDEAEVLSRLLRLNAVRSANSPALSEEAPVSTP